ncbi:P-loop containing nucleoside triphosphate hydrolase protein [Mycena pura]|uniref:DNA 3'-5' helicase n=1 Tax=Mycena pura TaxID=153505 RepID=A0AAD6UYT8_9AGAR|nr:P-loop containing nucleoside triphosphate hydrolase protein [Mycena pura]
MEGHDIILDVGTGSGKSMCYDLPVMPHKEDIVLVVSPLTALMLEQRVTEGTAQRIFVSPEVAGSLHFSKKVLSQPRLQEHLRLVFVDEAHCVSLWGGSFRSEYGELGVLRGRVPPTVAFAIASATLPTHVLDDVCAKLKISKDAVKVSLSNARPNVALSVRKIVHPDETKADLRFLIPEIATVAADIPVAPAYFNQRLGTEDACDRLQSWATSVGIDSSAIGFYHAKIGTAQKRQLEGMLRDGRIRILCCTDAGCDMRNIERVVLWKMPPSFCALAQRSGRAARDFEKLGEAILFVTAKVLKDGIAEEQARLARVDAAVPHDQPQAVDPTDVAQAEGLDVVGGQAVLIAEGGARVEQGTEGENADAETPDATAVKKKKRKAARESFVDALEAKFLSRFACTTACRRLVGTNIFKTRTNFYRTASLDVVLPDGARCCDICEPARFPVELVEVQKIPGLKGGKKRKFPPGLSDLIRDRLRAWSRGTLMPMLYPKEAGFSITGSVLLPDSTIEQLAICGERVDNLENLKRRARWFLMESHGTYLFAELQNIFQSYDALPPDDLPGEPPGDLFDIVMASRPRYDTGATWPGFTSSRSGKGK